MKQNKFHAIIILSSVSLLFNLFSVALSAKNFNADILSKSARKSLRGPSGGFGSGSDEGGFSFGLGLNYNVINLDKSGKSLGLSGMAEYASAKFGYRLGYFYGFPNAETYPIIGLASDGSFSMFSTNYTNSINMSSLFLDSKLFFNGNADGFYLFGGIAYNNVTMKQELETAKTGFNFNISPKTVFNQIFLRFGLGADIPIGFGKFFIDGQLSLPANTVNGVNVFVVLPAYFGATTGIKFDL
jgi:hypothetical protein